MFSYYSNWIYRFSKKIQPLAHADKFPLNDNALHAFSTLKNDIARSVLNCINEDEPFVIETDVSDYAIADTHNQNRIFSLCTLNCSEL